MAAAAATAATADTTRGGRPRRRRLRRCCALRAFFRALELQRALLRVLVRAMHLYLTLRLAPRAAQLRSAAEESRAQEAAQNFADYTQRCRHG